MWKVGFRATVLSELSKLLQGGRELEEKGREWEGLAMVALWGRRLLGVLR
jgi:hypothetical protein